MHDPGEPIERDEEREEIKEQLEEIRELLYGSEDELTSWKLDVDQRIDVLEKRMIMLELVNEQLREALDWVTADDDVEDLRFEIDHALREPDRYTVEEKLMNYRRRVNDRIETG